MPPSFKGKKIKNNLFKELHFEEVFLDALIKKQKIRGEIKDIKIESPVKRASFYAFFAFSLALLIVILFSAFRLQVLANKEYLGLAQANKFISLKIQAERGVMYDRNMKQLIFNDTRFDVFAQKSEMGSDLEKEKTLQEVFGILEKEFKEIEAKIQESQDDFVEIAQDISHKDLILIETRIEELPGIKIKKRIKREYISTGGLSHVLGYMGEISAQALKQEGEQGVYEVGDYVGKEGLEKRYEEVLAEKGGLVEIERDAKGKEISKITKEEPSSGSSLVLGLDFNLQEKLFQALSNAAQDFSGQGAAIALNPKNGEILALVSLPAFDNNLFARGISQEELKVLNEDKKAPQLNRVIAALYPTGSAVKPFIASAGLEEGIIKEETSLFCPEELCVENKYTKEKECFSDWKFHGWTDVKRALAESVNPFFYMLGGGYVAPSFVDERIPKKFNGLGEEKIAEYLSLFGFGEESGVDLPGENKGRVPTPEWKENYFETKVEQKWYLADTYNLSIGQGYFLATPLQLALATAALANNGTLFKPKILKSIINQKNEETREENPTIRRENFISPENISIVKQGMRGAVSSSAGSAFLLNSLPVKAAAKTGTAQTSKQDVYQNWISVFVPYDDPEIVLTVVIESVPGLQSTAQRVAFDVLNWYFTNPKSHNDQLEKTLF